jgi:hypothetical protein
MPDALAGTPYTYEDMGLENDMGRVYRHVVSPSFLSHPIQYRIPMEIQFQFFIVLLLERI